MVFWIINFSEIDNIVMMKVFYNKIFYLNYKLIVKKLHIFQ